MGFTPRIGIEPVLVFPLVIDELINIIHDEVSWCTPFADDIMLIDKISESVNLKLELWRSLLESKCFQISRNKTNYMHCKD